MNRQALVFLTMFSLILMLSVYYVTLPADTTAVMSTESGEQLQDDKKQSEKEEQVNDAEKLQQEITSKQEEEIKKNSEVVSSNESNDAQKQEALQTIDSLKSDKAIGEDVKKTLEEHNFMGAVEIMNGTCKVTIFDIEDTEENAKTVMKIVNDATNGKYLIEVTFK